MVNKWYLLRWDRDNIRWMIQPYGHILKDHKEALGKAGSKGAESVEMVQYELRDASKINIGAERFMWVR